MSVIEFHYWACKYIYNSIWFTASTADVLTRIKELLQEQRDLLKDNCTAFLWLQYHYMVDILRMFIKAIRTGNCWFHLQALPEMLPHLAAAGNNLYSMSVLFYLESMSSLKTDLPDVCRKLIPWFHVVRGSIRLWTGLSTDLVTE